MRAAVVEDQALVREYLAGVLRHQLGATEIRMAGSMLELGRLEAKLGELDLVLLDIELEDGSTIDWALERASHPGRPRLVALSSITTPLPLKRLQQAGLSLAHKNDGEADLVEVIQQTLGGAVMISRQMMKVLASAGRDQRAPLKLLGQREQEVLALLGHRFSSDEIAEILGVAASTAADHRKRIMRKLGLHSIEQVIDYAIEHGLIYDSRAMAARQFIRRGGDRTPR